MAIETVSRLSEKTQEAGRSYRGFNFFSEEDLHLFEIIVRGEHTLQGLRNRNLREHMPGMSAGQVKSCQIVREFRMVKITIDTTAQGGSERGFTFPRRCSPAGWVSAAGGARSCRRRER